MVAAADGEDGEAVVVEAVEVAVDAVVAEAADAVVVAVAVEAGVDRCGRLD